MILKDSLKFYQKIDQDPNAVQESHKAAEIRFEFEVSLVLKVYGYSKCILILNNFQKPVS